MERREPVKTNAPNAAATRESVHGDHADDIALSSLLDSSLRVLRRRYKLAVLAFVVFTVPALALVVRRPLTFQATGRIVVERNPEANLIATDNRTSEPVDDLKTQAQVLKSRPIVAKAIERMKLWEVPEFALPGASGGQTTAQTSALIDPFLNHLTVWQEPGTRVLSVTFSAAEASIASHAVTTLIQAFIDEQTQSQLDSSGQLTDWLKSRLDEQKARLDQSENALQQYMESRKAVSVQQTQNIVVQKLADLNTAVTRAKTERIAKETLYNQLVSTQDPSAAVEALPIALSNAQLQRLRSQLGDLKQKEVVLAQDLGDKHPNLIALRSEVASTEEQLRGALTKVIDAVKTEYTSAQALEQSLSSALEQQTREVLELNRQSLDYNALERQATADRLVYERLLSESQTRGIAGRSPLVKVRIVEPADVPRAPIQSNRRRDLLLAVGAGLLLALSAPIVRESLDTRIKTPADIEKLGLSCLALVPAVKVEPTSPGPLLSAEPTNFNEAFRRLRTQLASHAPRRGAITVVVNSAAPRDGKTMVAVNLALALAHANEPVLLVDGDLRRPKVHKMLQISPFPGLADLLSGEVAAGEAIRSTTIPNLFVLPSGMKRLSSSELLSHARVSRLVEQLENDFAWIVFDSPPIGAVADATVLAQNAQSILLVVSADRTPVAAARAAVHQLAASGTPIAGAILNRADLDRAGFYYEPYYSSAYSDYYAAETTFKAPAALR